DLELGRKAGLGSGPEVIRVLEQERLELSALGQVRWLLDCGARRRAPTGARRHGGSSLDIDQASASDALCIRERPTPLPAECQWWRAPAASKRTFSARRSSGTSVGYFRVRQ